MFEQGSSQNKPGMLSFLDISKDAKLHWLTGKCKNNALQTWK